MPKTQNPLLGMPLLLINYVYRRFRIYFILSFMILFGADSGNDNILFLSPDYADKAYKRL